MDTEIIVVGAGPVGLMLAGELRLGGAEVTVLERLAAPTAESRASTLHARTMEILDQRGLLTRMGTPPNDRMGHFGGLPLDLSGLSTRYPGQWKVPQRDLEAVLADWASGLGADIRREHELCGLSVTGDEVRVRAATPAGCTVLTCGYLVGCDGEESTVRRLGGFAFPGTDATRELLHADIVGIATPDRRFARFPRGVVTAARRGDITRVMVHEFGRPVRDRADKLSFAEVAAAWARVTLEDIGGGRPLWLHVRGNASRQAACYQMGRVLLAGDAAHQQMPVGGQALNLGLHDAANLGWKLAAEVRGWAPAGLLDSYHAERHPAGQRVLTNIGAQALLLTGGPEVEATRAVLGELLSHAAVRAHLGSMIGGIDVRYGSGDHPLVGARMPHTELDTGSGPVSTTELLRTGRGVLLDLSADPARRAWMEDATAPWADRVRLVTARVPVPAGTPATLPDTVLLRPDDHVAWTGDRKADPRAALGRWFGAATFRVPRAHGHRTPAEKTALTEKTPHRKERQVHVQHDLSSPSGS